MLFRHNDLGSALDKASQLLEDSSYLTDAESTYHPSMIPIRENSRLGKNIIRLEDLVEYSIDNGITDGGYAVNSVCEANMVDADTIAFSIDEVSAIVDPEMADTAIQLKEAGFDVYAAPISSYNPIAQLTEAVVDTMIQCNGTEYERVADSIFEAFINDEYDKVLSEASIVDKIKPSEEQVKNAVASDSSDSKKFAAEKLAALKKKLAELKVKAGNCVGAAKEAVMNAIGKCKQAIIHLKDGIASKF